LAKLWEARVRDLEEGAKLIEDRVRKELGEVENDSVWRLNVEMVRLREEIRVMGEKYERIRKEKEEMNEVIKEKENEIRNM